LFDAAPVAEAAVDYHAVAVLPERRSENDIGGRIDVSKGWRPNIPAPSQSSNALAKVYAAQSSTSAEVVAP
jgi:hypothetical protein